MQISVQIRGGLIRGMMCAIINMPEHVEGRMHCEDFSRKRTCNVVM